jgi:hypothetical protein
MFLLTYSTKVPQGKQGVLVKPKQAACLHAHEYRRILAAPTSLGNGSACASIQVITQVNGCSTQATATTLTSGAVPASAATAPHSAADFR